MGYKQIKISAYLKKIRNEYIDNPKLWYDSIIPQNKADELKKQVNGDFSLLWHEHCNVCWEKIDSNTKRCYYDDANEEWLCEK